MDDKCNIVLVNACFSVSAVFGKYHFIPSGILSLATVLKKAGYTVKIIDTRLPYFSVNYLKTQLLELNPSIVGIGFMTDNFFTAKRIAKIVRNILPEAKIILGGPHATILDTESLEKIDADVVVRGEAEDTIIELAKAIVDKNANLNEIAGITYRSGKDVLRNPDRTPPDLTKLPAMDFNLLENFSMHYNGTIITGRGCPYHCTFCAANNISPRYRERPIEMVISEIKTLKEKYGIRFFQIIDDTFVANPKRVKELCYLFKKYFRPQEDFFWYAEGRANILAKNPDLIPIMKEAGLVRVQLGVESGDKRQLQAYHKGITLRDVEKVVKQCRKHTTQVICSFIIGGPFEDDKTEKNQKKFIAKLLDISGGLVEIIPSFLNPLPGTDIYNHPERYGITILDPELKTSDYFNYCVVETDKKKKRDIIAERTGIIDMMNHKMLEMLKHKHVSQSVLSELGRVHKHCGIMHRTFLMKEYGENALKELGRGFYKWKLTNKIYRTFSGTREEDMENFCPERNSIFIFGSNDGRLTVHAPLGTLTLDDFEEHLFELSAGKLTFGEIINLLAAEKFSNFSLDKIKRHAIDVYRKFEEYELIHLREI